MRYNDTNLEPVLFSVFFIMRLLLQITHSVCFLLAISPHLDLTELTLDHVTIHMYLFTFS
jgi:hypothetical protein